MPSAIVAIVATVGDILLAIKRLFCGKRDLCSCGTATCASSTLFMSLCAWWWFAPSAFHRHHKPVLAVLTSHGVDKLVHGNDYRCE